MSGAEASATSEPVFKLSVLVLAYHIKYYTSAIDQFKPVRKAFGQVRVPMDITWLWLLSLQLMKKS